MTSILIYLFPVYSDRSTVKCEKKVPLKLPGSINKTVYRTASEGLTRLWGPWAGWAQAVRFSIMDDIA
ncbi:unnamed protein product [Protopolystoma xenopodis]|uniref:Uncharacterized protein n=1 Tax=Protopolystoma xenopodis TaxID=117903 RepID=A0A448WE33_9PLAT|nr:unnamed protein product [Protopolystoma xenopodis]